MNENHTYSEFTGIISDVVNLLAENESLSVDDPKFQRILTDVSEEANRIAAEFGGILYIILNSPQLYKVNDKIYMRRRKKRSNLQSRVGNFIPSPTNYDSDKVDETSAEVPEETKPNRNVGESCATVKVTKVAQDDELTGGDQLECNRHMDEPTCESTLECNHNLDETTDRCQPECNHHLDKISGGCPPDCSHDRDEPTGRSQLEYNPYVGKPTDGCQPEYNPYLDEPTGGYQPEYNPYLDEPTGGCQPDYKPYLDEPTSGQPECNPCLDEPTGGCQPECNHLLEEPTGRYQLQWSHHLDEPHLADTQTLSSCDSFAQTVDSCKEDSFAQTVDSCKEDSFVQAVDSSKEDSIAQAVDSCKEDSFVQAVDSSKEDSIAQAVDSSKEDSFAQAVDSSKEDSFAQAVDSSKEDTFAQAVDSSKEDSFAQAVDSCKEDSFVQAVDSSKEDSIARAVDSCKEDSFAQAVDSSKEDSIAQAVDSSKEDSFAQAVDSSKEDSFVQAVDSSKEDSIARAVDSCKEDSFAQAVDSSKEDSIAQAVDSSKEDSFAQAVDSSKEDSFAQAVDSSKEDTFAQAVDSSKEDSIAQAVDSSKEDSFAQAVDSSKEDSFAQAVDCSKEDSFAQAVDCSKEESLVKMKELVTSYEADLDHLKKMLKARENQGIEQTALVSYLNSKVESLERRNKKLEKEYSDLHSSFMKVIVQLETLVTQYNHLKDERDKNKTLYFKLKALLDTWLDSAKSAKSQDLSLILRNLQLLHITTSENYNAIKTTYLENRALLDVLKEQVFQMLLDVVPYHPYLSEHTLKDHYFNYWDIGNLSPLYCKCPAEVCTCISRENMLFSQPRLARFNSLFRNVDIRHEPIGDPEYARNYSSDYKKKAVTEWSYNSQFTPVPTGNTEVQSCPQESSESKVQTFGRVVPKDSHQLCDSNALSMSNIPDQVHSNAVVMSDTSEKVHSNAIVMFDTPEQFYVKSTEQLSSGSSDSSSEDTCSLSGEEDSHTVSDKHFVESEGTVNPLQLLSANKEQSTDENKEPSADIEVHSESGAKTKSGNSLSDLLLRGLGEKCKPGILRHFPYHSLLYESNEELTSDTDLVFENMEESELKDRKEGENLAEFDPGSDSSSILIEDPDENFLDPIGKGADDGIHRMEKQLNESNLPEGVGTDRKRGVAAFKFLVKVVCILLYLRKIATKHKMATLFTPNFGWWSVRVETDEQKATQVDVGKKKRSRERKKNSQKTKSKESAQTPRIWTAEELFTPVDLPSNYLKFPPDFNKCTKTTDVTNEKQSDSNEDDWTKVICRQRSNRSNSESRAVNCEGGAKQRTLSDSREGAAACEATLLGIPVDAKRKAVKDVLRQFGQIQKLHFYPDGGGYKNRRAYVLFLNAADCRKALNKKVILIGKSPVHISDVTSFETREIILSKSSSSSELQHKLSPDMVDDVGIKTADSWARNPLKPSSAQQTDILFDYRKRANKPGAAAAATWSSVTSTWPREIPGSTKNLQNGFEAEADDFVDTQFFKSKELMPLVTYLSGVFPAIPKDELAQSLIDTRRKRNYDHSGISCVELTKEIFLDRLHKTGADTEECLLCNSEYGEGETVVLACLHIYHKMCYDGWRKVHGRCPMCGSELRKLTE